MDNKDSSTCVECILVKSKRNKYITAHLVENCPSLKQINESQIIDHKFFIDLSIINKLHGIKLCGTAVCNKERNLKFVNTEENINMSNEQEELLKLTPIQLVQIINKQKKTIQYLRRKIQEGEYNFNHMSSNIAKNIALNCLE